MNTQLTNAERAFRMAKACVGCSERELALAIEVGLDEVRENAAQTAMDIALTMIEPRVSVFVRNLFVRRLKQAFPELAKG